mmetsp:Transcript_9569/g.21237  ORF Transcript_9569/g.21237 Transcript_9569/m.21237 type:complete len:348 (+) Transcript_9569:363-1406(+)
MFGILATWDSLAQGKSVGSPCVVAEAPVDLLRIHLLSKVYYRVFGNFLIQIAVLDENSALRVVVVRCGNLCIVLILGNALGRVEGFSFGGGSGVQQPMEGANGLHWMTCTHMFQTALTTQAVAKSSRQALLHCRMLEGFLQVCLHHIPPASWVAKDPTHLNEPTQKIPNQLKVYSALCILWHSIEEQVQLLRAVLRGISLQEILSFGASVKAISIDRSSGDPCPVVASKRRSLLVQIHGHAHIARPCNEARLIHIKLFQATVVVVDQNHRSRITTLDISDPPELVTVAPKSDGKLLHDQVPRLGLVLWNWLQVLGRNILVTCQARLVPAAHGAHRRAKMRGYECEQS